MSKPNPAHKFKILTGGPKDFDQMLTEMCDDLGVDPTVRHRVKAVMLRYMDTNDLLFRLVGNELDRVTGSDITPVLVSQVLSLAMNMTIEHLQAVKDPELQAQMADHYARGYNAMGQTILAVCKPYDKENVN